MSSRKTLFTTLLVVFVVLIAYIVLVMLSDARDPYGTPDEAVER